MTRVVGNYTPSAVEVSLFGIKAEGFSPDSTVKVTRDSVSVTLQRATDGTATARLDKFVPYKVSVFLQNSSPTNSWFHLIYKMYETYGADFKMPLMVQDKSGDTRLFGTDVFFEKVPDTDFGNTMGTSEWVFLVVSPSFTKGGNVDPNEIIETLQMLDGAIRVAGMFGISLGGFESKISEFGSDAVSKLKEMF